MMFSGWKYIELVEIKGSNGTFGDNPPAWFLLFARRLGADVLRPWLSFDPVASVELVLNGERRQHCLPKLEHSLQFYLGLGQTYHCVFSALQLFAIKLFFWKDPFLAHKPPTHIL